MKSHLSHTIVGLLGFLAAAAPPTSAASEKKCTVGQWQCSVRQSLLDKNALGKPAAFQLTFPAEGPRSYAADLGLTVSRPLLGAAALWECGIGVELHRNTLTDKKQDTLLAGLTASGVIGDPSGVSWLPQLALKVKRDRVKGTKSYLPSATATLTDYGLAIGHLRGPGGLQFFWQPTVGAEAEVITNAAGGKPTGTIGRALARIDVALYPLAGVFDHRLEVSVSATSWWDVSRSSALKQGSDHHILRGAAVNYYLDAAKHFSIGFDVVNGEDVDQGLPLQRFRRLALKVLF